VARTEDRIKELLQHTGLHRDFFKGKYCLDAGCGNGRFTYAMLHLGVSRVDSIDISPEGIAKTKEVNPDYAQVKSIFELEPNPAYDFVLCWGVLNHVDKPREGFSKVTSQVKKGGVIHLMVYHKDLQAQYKEGRKKWRKWNDEERIQYCQKMIKECGGDLHGWWDALNPLYNWSWLEEEIEKWFEEEGFRDIKLVQKYNINMRGVKNT